MATTATAIRPNRVIEIQQVQCLVVSQFEFDGNFSPRTVVDDGLPSDRFGASLSRSTETPKDSDAALHYRASVLG
ncbi:MAG: hypothetical protein AAFY84_16255, partial [Pseudomonadota bacterium]